MNGAAQTVLMAQAVQGPPFGPVLPAEHKLRRNTQESVRIVKLMRAQSPAALRSLVPGRGGRRSDSGRFRVGRAGTGQRKPRSDKTTNIATRMEVGGTS